MKKFYSAVKSSLALRVLIGFILGILAGLFFGEMTSVLGVVGLGYIRLFQMPVIPYIFVSLISGLGKLNFTVAKGIFIKGGITLLSLWIIIIFVLLLIPFGFPRWESASFFSTSLVEPEKSINFLDLFLPSNPFNAMANTIIPSIVTFSVAVGLAFIFIPEKSIVIEVFSKLSDSLMLITRWVAKLAPIGVFAIAANAAGTLRFDDLERLQVYIILQACIALILSFWILPKLITVLTPIKYQDIIDSVKNPLATAFATANLLVVIPILVDNSKKLIENRKINETDTDEKESPLDVIIPASFNFPSMGKLLSLGFIPFAAWYVGSPLSPTQYPSFLVAGIAGFFADGTLATTFLLNLFKIPADMLTLYITVEIFTARFGTLVAAMHTVVLGILATCAIQGLIVVRRKKIIRFTITSILLLALTVGSIHFIYTYFFPSNYTKNQILSNLELLRVRNPQPAKVSKTPPIIENSAAQKTSESRYEQIKSNNLLRACYLKDDYPFSYFNSQGDLVGLDVEMAHILARELGLKLEFIPLEEGVHERAEIAAYLNGNYCDILIPALALTPQATEVVKFTHSFSNRTLAFVVKDYQKDQFSNWQELQKKPNLRLEIPGNVPYYIAKLKGLLPNAEVVVTKRNIRDLLVANSHEFDAIVLPAENAAAWTILYPSNAVAVPQPIVSIPVGYMLPKNANSLADIIDVWLDLKQEDGTITSLYDYWVQGNIESVKEPRWSIIRNVLGWVK
ncbi:cation:dicarboxylate symporter family transporter [Crocosphaera watsonii]|uniref:Sodium:dicarboxylate symporter family/bacterial extracellular solute-binding family 3 protein n=5 Tax=Crocosphaera watsonii TaxID=263511 RepID=G5J4Y4_CROWT|nr:cation:dicarboxylase symporter family transporter [Crocosphaera watsonii]EHJ12717.1 sodium:dicarboxylate symporter family/bacterial extracellular solute-binding family 3 protein [Crocosphaera watsonii WH 0003]CCQ58320.1 sodium:dicarboxylate symporter family/bacterial extracellular solute-binding family 3 protein [Crocosphaera watsonii WH 0005]